jgi:predicted component of type VI protein secretion system
MASPRSLAVVAAFLAVCSAPAPAQWAWRDAGGRLVYSDRPPPAGVKPNQIVKQPGGPAAQPPAPVYVGEQSTIPADPAKKADPAKPAAASNAGPKTMAEKEMEYRKRAQENADAEKKAAEEQVRQQRLAQECERARGYLRALEDGRRIARTDAQGNQVFLDDRARAAEVARVRSQVAESCN